MKLKTLLITLSITLVLSTAAISREYKVDIKGMHASVQFKISHLGTSWLWGRFDKFDGTFNYNKEKPNESSLSMTIDTTSVNTNHAERDKHIRGKGLLETNDFPQASFKSDKVKFNADGTGTITGKLKLHGVEKEITMAIKKVGEGVDPWGGYRAGFEGAMKIVMADYGITKNLGKASEILELIVAIEGVRQHK